MKKFLLFLLITPLFYTSCNDEDSCNNFLDCNNNSVWEINLGSFIVYDKFHNSDSNPIEEWHKVTNEVCYYYFGASAINETTIVENHKNQLNIRISNPEDNYEYRLLTFFENGNTINLKLEIFENGISKSVGNYILKRSNFDPYNIQICSKN